MAGGKAVKKSDLGVRTLSAIIMVAVAGVAIWIGGNVFNVFAALIGLAVLSEWVGLTQKFNKSTVPRAIWILGGLGYVSVAVFALGYLNQTPSRVALVTVVGAVIATDIGAYFAGRTIGGPKIAPRISPSKTWAGLGGGMIGASIVFAALLCWPGDEGDAPGPISLALFAAVLGAGVAVVAQAGDFFESWMKRRAGVKDSGSLIPGHGGVFDRVDGLLAVCFIFGLLLVVYRSLIAAGFAGSFSIP